MKFAFGVLAVLLVLNGVFGLPAKVPQDEVEEIDVPRHRVPTSEDEPDYKDFAGVIDTGAGYPFLRADPIPFSFNLGFFDSLEDIFRRLRTRWFRVATNEDGETESDEGGLSFKFDPKKANTTSTVKVVDGRKIEVNDTVFGGDNHLFRVRIVNISPLESGEDVEVDTVQKTNGNPVTSAPKKPNDLDEFDESNERREPLENKSDENEIKGNIDDPEVKGEKF